MLQEVADEWQIPVWIAAIDFKKAFDSVTHESIWAAMREQKVPELYISLLSRLYDHQTGAAKTDCSSRTFQVERGVKQGDPLSSLLFNCVSESLFRKVKHAWTQEQIGLPLQPHQTPHNTMTNLRFADDVLLVARSLPQIARMLNDLSAEAHKVGLQLHPDKTKILHNGYQPHNKRRQRTPNNIHINDMTIDILPTTDSTKYLGRQFTFSDPHRTELENRISRAWRTFYRLKHELTGHRYSLNDRLRLFHGTVTPTVLYGCEAWTMTAELDNRLKRTQRQMLRMILHAPTRRNTTHLHFRRRCSVIQPSSFSVCIRASAS